MKMFLLRWFRPERYKEVVAQRKLDEFLATLKPRVTPHLAEVLHREATFSGVPIVRDPKLPPGAMYWSAGRHTPTLYLSGGSS